MGKKLLHIAVLTVTIVISSLFFFSYGSKSATLYGDALGYYMYLPPTFIYQNHKSLNDMPDDRGIPRHIFSDLNRMNEQKTPMGYTLNQYTYGVAIMELPFFLIAHAYEKTTGGNGNGFSATYVNLIKISSIVYGLLGLLLVYKILKNYFSDTHSLLGTVLIFAGTNLFWFMLYQAGMSHVPLFFLYALLIMLTIKIHQQPKTLLLILTGLTAGMITIIRPTDILCLLIPLLYNVYSKETFFEKLSFIKANKTGLLISIVAFALPIVPQLLYWKMVSGNYLFYSYGHQSFNWRHPKIIEGLFCFSNGWLPYSPIMIFSLAGILFSKSFRNCRWPILIILPIYVYIIYSWYCYNYINGLGSRPMIHLYPLLAIPMVALVAFISRQKILIKTLFTLVCVFFVALNLSYCMQQIKGVIRSEESNWKFQYQMLFHMHLTYDDLVVRDLADWQPGHELTKIGTLACQHYEDSSSENYVRDTTLVGKYVYEAFKDEYTDIILTKYSKQRFSGAKWFKCTGRFMYPETPNFYKHLLVVEVPGKFQRACTIENKINGPNPEFYRKNDITQEYSQPNKWGYVSFYAKIPSGLKDGDDVKLFIWNTGKRPLFMDDVCLELYK